MKVLKLQVVILAFFLQLNLGLQRKEKKKIIRKQILFKSNVPSHLWVRKVKDWRSRRAIAWSCYFIFQSPSDA